MYLTGGAEIFIPNLSHDGFPNVIYRKLCFSNALAKTATVTGVRPPVGSPTSVIPIHVVPSAKLDNPATIWQDLHQKIEEMIPSRPLLNLLKQNFILGWISSIFAKSSKTKNLS
jgi:hypothetical protein